jgi:hypothetical protein
LIGREEGSISSMSLRRRRRQIDPCPTRRGEDEWVVMEEPEVEEEEERTEVPRMVGTDAVRTRRGADRRAGTEA